MSDTMIEGADDAPEAAPEAVPEPPPDARGPHLPGAMTRSYWLAWAFVLLAVGDVVWYITTVKLPADPVISDLAIFVLQLLPGVAAILMPAVLLARHPDAIARARTLLFGMILYAAVQGLLIVSEPLQGFFESVSPPSQDLPNLVPMAALYNGLIALVAAFGLTYIAVGLSQVRRYVDRGGRVTALFVPIAGIFGTVVGVLAVSRLQLGSTPWSPTLAIYLGASVILGILRIVVWAYLATTLTRGLLAGEEPRRGWLLGALAGGLVVLALVLVNLNGVIDIPDQTLATAYGYVIVLAYSLGHASLLGAFALGLPSLDEFDDEEDDEDDYDDEEEFEHDHGDEFDDEDEDMFEDERGN
jgi:hypothetical protein